MRRRSGPDIHLKIKVARHRPAFNEQAFDLGGQHVGADHAVHQTSGAGFFSADEFAIDQHFHRQLVRHVAHQGHAGRGAKQPRVNAVHAKARGINRHRQIALRHQLATRRRGQPLHWAITGTGNCKMLSITLVQRANSCW